MISERSACDEKRHQGCLRIRRYIDQKAETSRQKGDERRRVFERKQGPGRRIFYGQRMNHIRRAIDKINAIPQIYAFLFFEILIAVRVYAEFGRENPLTIAVFQLFWFTSVLIYFFAFFKWMLKLRDEDLTFFALGGFLPMIPVIFAFVVDRELTLNFVEPTSFLAVLKNIFTLEAAHSYNWALFPELLALLLLSFEAGWLISEKPLKSALAAFHLIGIGEKFPGVGIVVTGIEYGTVGLDYLVLAFELGLKVFVNRVTLTVEEVEHDAEGKHVLRFQHGFVVHTEVLQGLFGEFRDRGFHHLIVGEGAVHGGVILITGLLQSLLGNGVGVDNDDGAWTEPAHVGFDGSRVHGHENVAEVTGGVDGLVAEVDLEA